MTISVKPAPAMLRDEPPEAAFVLSVDESVGDGLARIMAEQVDIASWHLGLIGVSDGHVHEVRKATKRLRAILRLVRDEVGADAYRDINVNVRDVARELSQARSCVVQVELLESLVDEDGDLAAPTSGLHRDLTAEAGRSRAEMVESLVEDLTERLDAARAGIEDFGLGSDGAFAGSGVRRTYRRGRRAMARAYETGSPADFHVWRKHVKYLRHQMEVFAGVGTDDVTVLTVDLERIGEALGADNDLTDLATTATDRRELRDQSRLLELIARKRDGIEADLKSVAAQVYEASPRSFLLRVAVSLA